MQILASPLGHSSIHRFTMHLICLKRLDLEISCACLTSVPYLCQHYLQNNTHLYWSTGTSSISYGNTEWWQLHMSLQYMGPSEFVIDARYPAAFRDTFYHMSKCRILTLICRRYLGKLCDIIVPQPDRGGSNCVFISLLKQL